ncbi:MAG: hypothetical protein ACJATT_001799 [Myxococcota bacterium]|jgi:hypothetical protein
MPLRLWVSVDTEYSDQPVESNAAKLVAAIEVLTVPTWRDFSMPRTVKTKPILPGTKTANSPVDPLSDELADSLKSAPVSAASKPQSVYDRLPGLREALKPQAAEGGAVDGAKKSLGIVEPRVAEDPPVTKDPGGQALSEMLVRTGRSNGVPTSDKLGGARTKEADTKADATAKKVLMGMEKATQENQIAHNTFAKKGDNSFKETNLTHAVSGHGAGSDQVARLLHGRRGDELEHDEQEGITPSESVSLSGNEAVGAVDVAKYDTIGADPKNTSGAFSSDRSMLHVVGEAFAQANMLDSHRSSKGNMPTGNDVSFAATVGTNEDIGYNLTVKDHGTQTSGQGLSHDEMEERYKSIQRDPHQTNATVVLNPSYTEGKRTGWNLQTAYANNSAPSESFSSPGDVEGSSVELQSRHMMAKEAFEAGTAKMNSTKKAMSDNIGGIRGQEAGLRIATAKSETDPTNEAELAKKQGYEERLPGLRLATAGLKQAFNEAKAMETKAKKAFQTVDKEVAKAAKKAKADRALESESSTSDTPKAASSGYDPATGTWTGGRPDKPSDSESIRGTDDAIGTLTAHHLYPWNKIEASLNDALGGKSKAKLEKLFMFGKVTVGETFWTELAKEPDARSYAFAETLNSNVPKICWSPDNIFMGPAPDERGSDDPKEEIDAAPTSDKQKLPTGGTALAMMLEKDGGVGDASPLTQILMRNIRDGGGTAQGYDAKQWKKKGSELHRRGTKSSLNKS